MSVYGAVEDAERLRGSRDLVGALRTVQAALPDAVGQDAKRLTLTAARVQDALGHPGTASVRFGEAALLDGNDLWARAWWLEAGVRAVALEARTPWIQALSGHIAAHPGPDGVPFRWALARSLCRPATDDPPISDAYGAAIEDRLGAALEIDPDHPAILLERLRVKRHRAEAPDANRAAVIEEFRDLLADLRTGPWDALKAGAAGIDRLEASVAYLEGHVEILARRWDAAEQAFDAIVRHHDSSDARAHGWLLYVRRIRGDVSEDVVLDGIEGLLDSAVRPETILDPATQVQPPGPIVIAEVEAELRTDRAVLREDRDPDRALEDYRWAVARRPRMAFAHRGVIRCLRARNRIDEARAAVDEAMARVPGVSAELLVERGRLHMAIREPEPALALFRDAALARPTYGYAYESQMQALRALRRFGDAIRMAEERLAAGNLPAPNGLRVELGYTHLHLNDLRAAIDCFDEAREDGRASVRRRARAGLLHAYRHQRQFDRAREQVDEADREFAPTGGPGPTLCEAAGWLHADLGDYRAALGCYDQGLDQRPRDVGLRIGKARTLRLLGQPTNARRLLRAQIDEFVPAARLRLETELGWVAIELGDCDDARQRFARALEWDPGSESALRGAIAAEVADDAPRVTVEGLVVLALERVASSPRAVGTISTEGGRAALRRGDLVGARERFSQANAADGANLMQRVLQADAYVERRALADAESSIAALLTLEHGRYANDPDVLLLQARERLAAGDPGSALRLYERVWKAHPRHQPALLGRGVALFDLDDHEEARNALREVGAGRDGRAPDNVLAAEMLAWSHVALEAGGSRSPVEGNPRLARATALCAAILTVEPTRASTYACQGVVAEARGDPAQADVYLRQAVQIDGSRLADARCHRAAFLLRAGRLEEARACLAELVSSDRFEPRVQLLLGVLHLDRDGGGAQAAVHLRQAAAADATNAAPVVALATALALERRLEDAASVLATGLGRVPARRALALRLARARIGCEQAADIGGRRAELVLESAHDDVNAAAQLAGRASERAHVEFHRGMVLFKQGRTNAARAAFDRARREDPTRQDAEQAWRLLGRSSDVDPNQQLVRRWANVAGIAILLLMAITLVVALVTALQGSAFRFPWGDVEPVLGALLVGLLLVGALPRLGGVKLPYGEISLLPPPPAPEPAALALEFGRMTFDAARMPLLLMSGPSPHRPPDSLADTE